MRLGTILPVLGVIALVLLAGGTTLAWNPPKPPRPTFDCNNLATKRGWQIYCEGKYVFPEVPIWEVYVDGLDSTCPSDIEHGQVAYLSKTYMPQGYSVVMKLWRGSRLQIVTKHYDSLGNLTP